MDMEDALIEIARQMAITNRFKIANELYKMDQYDPYEYVEILKDLEDDLVGE